MLGQQPRGEGRRKGKGKAGDSGSTSVGAGHRGVDHPYWMEKNVENLER